MNTEDKIGSSTKNIKVIENFIDDESLKILLDFAKSSSIDLNNKRVQEITPPYPEDIHNIIYRYTVLAWKEAYDHFLHIGEIEDLSSERRNFMLLMSYPPGSEMLVHTDVVGNIQKELEVQETAWNGHISILVYLNDDFSGGEIYFPDRDVIISPKPGMLILFPGTKNYEHGVKKVESGIRYTLSIWRKFKNFEY
jgi:hypothetical protein